jgi:hypothetical protein
MANATKANAGLMEVAVIISSAARDAWSLFFDPLFALAFCAERLWRRRSGRQLFCHGRRR